MSDLNAVLSRLDHDAQRVKNFKNASHIKYQENVLCVAFCSFLVK